MKAGWGAAELASVSKVFTDGNWIESKDQSSEGIRLVQTGNIGEGVFKDRRDKARWIDQQTFDRLNCFEVTPGDCLVSRLPDPVGRSCIIPDTGDKMITAVDCSVIRPDTSKVDPSFLVYFTQSSAYLRDVDSRCTGTTRRRISRKNLGKVTIPLPPLEEQQRIVAILDGAFEGLDRAKVNAEANLASARELFESELASIFASPPESWETAPLEQYCYKITVGHVGPMADRYVPKGVPFLRSQNVRPFAIDLTDVKFIDEKFVSELKKSELQPGDVAIVRTGYPGTAAVIPNELPLANCADLVIVRPGPKLAPDFLTIVLNSAFGKQLVSGAAVGAAQKHFNVGAAKRAVLPFPPYAEQQRLVVFVEKLRQQSEKLALAAEEKLQHLGFLRQSLLAQAFAGELT